MDRAASAHHDAEGLGVDFEAGDSRTEIVAWARRR